jgi:hypothetical protein
LAWNLLRIFPRNQLKKILRKVGTGCAVSYSPIGIKT